MNCAETFRRRPIPGVTVVYGAVRSLEKRWEESVYIRNGHGLGFQGEPAENGSSALDDAGRRTHGAWQRAFGAWQPDSCHRALGTWRFSL